MEGDVAEVEQDPTGFFAAFLVAHGGAFVLGFAGEPIDYRGKLEGGGGCRQHEVIGKTGGAADGEEGDVLGLQLGKLVNDAVR